MYRPKGHPTNEENTEEWTAMTILPTPRLAGFAVSRSPGHPVIYAPATNIGFDTEAEHFVVIIDDGAGQRHGFADEIDNLSTLATNLFACDMRPNAS